jgi:hypothetical protein
MTLDFYTFVSESEQTKRRLGIDESSKAVDAMRNKGGRRSTSKRILPAKAAERARAAGRQPIPAYF